MIFISVRRICESGVGEQPFPYAAGKKLSAEFIADRDASVQDRG
jgi:hypothetical protein